MMGHWAAADGAAPPLTDRQRSDWLTLTRALRPMKTRQLPLIALSLGCCVLGVGCATVTLAASAPPAKEPVTLHLRIMSVATMEAALARHTPVGTPLAEVQAFVRERLTHDGPYTSYVKVYPTPGEGYEARRHDQPLAMKMFSVHLGWYRSLVVLGFRTDYSAVYFFDADDRLLAVKIWREIDGL
jgi:hypothetical protein